MPAINVAVVPYLVAIGYLSTFVWYSDLETSRLDFHRFLGLIFLFPPPPPPRLLIISRMRVRFTRLTIASPKLETTRSTGLYILGPSSLIDSKSSPNRN